MNFTYRDDGALVLIGTWSHAQFLAGLVPAPFKDMGGELVKPRIRVKMGRA